MAVTCAGGETQLHSHCVVLVAEPRSAVSAPSVTEVIPECRAVELVTPYSPNQEQVCELLVVS